MSTKHLVVSGITCPHCGAVANAQGFELADDSTYLPLTRWRVIECDTELGGCGKRFAVEVEIAATAVAYTLAQVSWRSL